MFTPHSRRGRQEIAQEEKRRKVRERSPSDLVAPDRSGVSCVDIPQHVPDQVVQDRDEELKVVQ